MWDRPSRPNSTTWDAASYPNCSSFNVDGTGVKCSLTDYNWVTNRQYLLRVEVDWTGTVWTGKIKDMFTGNETVIGVMQLATEDYFGANHIAYVEYPAANSCSGNPSSQVLWEGPYANNGTAVARYAYADYRTDLDSPVCMNQNVTTTVTGKPTAIHTIADNAQTTTLPSREIWNPPVVATLPLTPATAGCATFNATINTWGLADNLWFEYGTNPAFGSTTTMPPVTYATYDPVRKGSNIQLSNFNLTATLGSASSVTETHGIAVSTLGASFGAKWMWEVRVGAGHQRHGMWLSGDLEYIIGARTDDNSFSVGWQSSGAKPGHVRARAQTMKVWSLYGPNGPNKSNNDILTFGWDADADTLVAYLNGNYQGTITNDDMASTYSSFSGTWYPADSGGTDTYGTWTVNYGASPFAHPIFGYTGVYSQSPTYIPITSTSATPVASTMCGLAANTPYFMRAVGEYNDPTFGKNPATSYGEKRQFTVDASGAIIADSVIVHDAPVVRTTGRVNVQQTTATLYGTLHTYGMATEIFGLCRVQVSVDSDAKEYIQFGSKTVPASNALINIDLNLTGLTGATNYECHINARSIAGEALSPSDVLLQTLSTAPENIPPSVPTGLAASAVSATQIDLNWTASTDNVGVTEYKVYRNGTQVGTPSGTSYSDSGLASATTYSYTVAACDAAGNCSAQSTAVLATTPDNVSPTVPADLAASAVGATQINLNWTASTDNVGVTEYKVYRNGTQVGTPSVTSYSDTGLASATTYSYTVAACDAAGNCSAQSTPPVSVTTPDNIAPSVPTGLVASAVDATQINLAWNASTDNVAVTAYKVYRNTLLIATLGNVLSYSNTGLTSATTYSYTVAACDAAANCSVPSSPPVSATTPNATGPDLIVTILTASIKNGQLKIADQVKNQGTGAAGSFKIGFYLSLNTVLDGPDIFITCTRSITSLAVNTSNPTGTKTAATSCTIPGTATKGANYVIGVTDYLNAVGEVSETNNNKTTATQVTIP